MNNSPEESATCDSGKHPEGPYRAHSNAVPYYKAVSGNKNGFGSEGVHEMRLELVSYRDGSEPLLAEG